MNRAMNATLAMLILALAVCSGWCAGVGIDPATGDPWPPLGQLVGGKAVDAAVQGDYVYVATGTALTVLDVSNPEAPHMISYCDVDAADAVALTPGYAYLVGGDWGGSLTTVDITDPYHPVGAGYLWWAGSAGGADVDISGNYAYIAAGSGGLKVVDISNPAAPAEVANLSLPQDSEAIAVEGSYAYLVGQFLGLQIVNISNPASPTAAGTLACQGRDVSVVGSQAYVADSSGYVRVINVSNPASPTQTGAASLLMPMRLDVADSVASVCTGFDSFYTVDVSNPASPTVLDWWPLPRQAANVTVSGSYAFVSDDDAGLRIIDVVPASDPFEVGFFNAYAESYDMAAVGDCLYITAIPGLQVLQATDPAYLHVIGEYPLPNTTTGVAVSGQYAYLARVPYSLCILDISDPRWPFMVGEMSLSGSGQRAIGLWDGLACVGDGNGVTVADVSDPANPTPVGFFATSGTIPALTVADGYAYVWDNNAGKLRIVGLANPASPTEVGWFPFDSVSRVAVAADYAYVAETYSGLTILNVADPANPVAVITAWNGPRNPFDIAVSGRYAYVADTSWGLRTIDISQPAHPVQVAYWPPVGAAVTVAVGGGRVYVLDLDWGILVFPEASPARVTGQVRVKGTTTNIAGATVKAYLDGEGILRGTATTNASGIYDLAALPSGQLIITTSKVGFVSQTKSGIAAHLAQTTYANFNLEVSGAISGQVKEQGTLANLQNVTVRAYLGGVLRFTKTTNASGIYLMDADLPAGTYTVTASKPGYETQTKAGISVSAGATTYVNFSIKRAALKGQVTAAAGGAKLVGATVEAYQGETLVGSTTALAPDAIYQFGPELPAGTYTVVGSKAGYVRQSKLGVAVSDGATTFVNFSLTTSGALKGQVKDKVSGNPIIGATVTARMGGVVRGTATTTAPYGIYEITSDLPPGTYSVGASKPGYLGQTRVNIVVTAGNTTYVNFGLQPQ